MILWWTLGGAVLFWSQAVSVAGLYATQRELDEAAASAAGNAAFIGMLGPARALDTVGGQVFWQSAAFGAVVAGLMSMFIVGRHSRAEEESGRDELVRSAAVGRRAPLVAAFLAAVGANVLLGTVTALSLMTVRQDSPLAGMPLAIGDSIALGAGLALCGCVFAALALAAAQLTQSTRSMYGLAGSGIGVAYLLRAIGDLGDGTLSWLSPIGWYQAMQPYAGVRWWPLALMLAATVAGAVVASALFERRDVGSGVFPARPGPATAGAGLRSGLGLAWRLHRGSVYGWTAALFFTGLSYGSIGDSVGDLLGDSDFVRDAFAGGAGGLVDGFYATACVLLALLAAGFAVSSTLRPRGEEDATHAEALLAAGLDRSSWLGGHVAMTVAGTVVTLAASGLGLFLGYGATTGDWSAAARYGPAVLPYIAPVLVLSAIARLLYGLAPRRMLLAWLPLALAVVILMFGESLQLPRWLRDLSPFEHLALAPAEAFRVLPVLVVAAVAAAVSAAGQFAFRRRDLG
jgi:ABC-2 type transport system permease protein